MKEIEWSIPSDLQVELGPRRALDPRHQVKELDSR